MSGRHDMIRTDHSKLEYNKDYPLGIEQIVY
jgi:hypothetical protein